MRLKFLLIIPLILALLFFSSPVAASEPIPWGDPWGYDSNGDGIISKSEALVAIADYFQGDITKIQALDVVALYFS